MYCAVSLNCFVQAGLMFRKNEKEMKESKPLEKIQLKHLIIAFIILGVGCFLALVVFFLEIIWGKKVHKAQQEIKGENQNMHIFCYN